MFSLAVHHFCNSLRALGCMTCSSEQTIRINIGVQQYDYSADPRELQVHNQCKRFRLLIPCAYARRVWMYCNWCFTSLQHKLPLHACDLRLWNSSYFGALKCNRYLLEVCPASTIVCNTFMQTCHIDQTWHRTIAGASKRCFLVATGLRLAQESCHRQDCTISGQGEFCQQSLSNSKRRTEQASNARMAPFKWQSEDIKGLDYAPLHVAARHWFFFWAFAVPRLCFFLMPGRVGNEKCCELLLDFAANINEQSHVSTLEKTRQVCAVSFTNLV